VDLAKQTRYLLLEFPDVKNTSFRLPGAVSRCRSKTQQAIDRIGFQASPCASARKPSERPVVGSNALIFFIRCRSFAINSGIAQVPNSS